MADVRYIAGVLLEQGEYKWAVFGIHRAAIEMAYTQEELDFLIRIGMHLRRALQIHKQLSLARLESQNMYRILDTLKMGVILIDEQRYFYYSNNKAQSILEQHKLFEFDHNNRIFTTRKNQLKFEKLLQNSVGFTSNVKTEQDNVLSLEGKNAKRFLISMTPLGQIKKQSLLLSESKNYVVLFITEKHEQQILATKYLKDQYALSPRECEICELFVNGLNLEQISENCHLTISSTRTYMKNIYAKLECTSQVELLHKLVAMTINFEHIA